MDWLLPPFRYIDLRSLMIRKFLNQRKSSFGFAFQGIREALRSETNLKIHLIATCVTILLGFVLRLETPDWLWIGLAITLVWITELLNTAAEALCDLIHPEKHPVIKRVKDICAAAVLISAFFALVVGALILLPKLMNLSAH